MPYPRSKDKTKNLILETAELEHQAGMLLLKIDENKKKIQGYFDENNIKKLEIPVEETNSKEVKVICRKSERCTIKYDAEKLRDRVDKEIYNEVTKKEYKINDIEELIKMLKSAGIKASEFKKLLTTKISVDGQAVKRLYEAGEIDMKQLEGAYTATISKSIKITEATSEK